MPDWSKANRKKAIKSKINRKNQKNMPEKNMPDWSKANRKKAMKTKINRKKLSC